jgi:hypothetical protein
MNLGYAVVGKPPVNTRVVGTVIVRMESERMGGKAILPMFDRPLWWHGAKRLEEAARIAGIDLYDVVVATSQQPKNDLLEEEASLYGYSCYRHPDESDVAGRHLAVLHNADAGFSLSCGADTPLGWYEHVPLEWEAAKRYNFPGRASWRWGDWNMDSVAAVAGTVGIRAAWQFQLWADLAEATVEREHWGMSEIRNWSLRQDNLVPPPRGVYTDWPKHWFELWRPWCLELDWPVDAITVGCVYDALYQSGSVVDTEQAILWIDAHPEYQYNRERQDSYVNQQGKLDWQRHKKARFLDYCQAALVPDDAARLYCRFCGEYLGYAKDRQLHRPDGSRITGDAQVTCSEGHFRMWHHNVDKAIAAGSAIIR